MMDHDGTPSWSIYTRQWPKVYELCQACFLGRTTHRHDRIACYPGMFFFLLAHQHTKHVQFSHVHVFFDYCNVQKRVTKPDTSGQCLVIPSMLPILL